MSRHDVTPAVFEPTAITTAAARRFSELAARGRKSARAALISSRDTPARPSALISSTVGHACCRAVASCRYQLVSSGTVTPGTRLAGRNDKPS